MHVVRVLSSQLRFGRAGSGPVSAGGAERGGAGEALRVLLGVFPEPAARSGNVEGRREAVRQRDQAGGAVGWVSLHLASDAGGPGRGDLSGQRAGSPQSPHGSSHPPRLPIQLPALLPCCVRCF